MVISPRYELPCEYAARNIFPSIRAAVARVLVEERRMSKYAAAKVLGTTPAAISYYLGGKRGDKFVDVILSDASMKRVVRKLADVLVRVSESSGEEGYIEMQRLVCDICNRLNVLAIKYGCPATGFKPVNGAKH
ncbi:MAG: transcriptional regulator [Desulfurococcales archaeon]|nr:transcriptional regulator [Desulfurococcales archaeon]